VTVHHATPLPVALSPHAAELAAAIETHLLGDETPRSEAPKYQINIKVSFPYFHVILIITSIFLTSSSLSHKLHCLIFNLK
jgi:hypothetical protein